MGRTTKVIGTDSVSIAHCRRWEPLRPQRGAPRRKGPGAINRQVMARIDRVRARLDQGPQSRQYRRAGGAERDLASMSLARQLLSRALLKHKR
jgi:hypothetical protein